VLGLMVRCCGMDFRRGLGRANERYELALPVMEHKKLLVMHAGDFASRLVIADPKSPQNGPSLASSSRIDSSMDLPETSVSPVFGCAMVFLRLFLTRTHQDNYSRFRWSLADVMQTVEICNSV
jgi:hypothetical protein